MKYQLVTTQDLQVVDDNGDPLTIPAGTVVNEIEWDGTTEYQPPPNTRLVLGG